MSRPTPAGGPSIRLRRQRILDQLASAGFARVSDLSRELGVSEVTVRKDLIALDGEAFIDRIHGGAVLRGLSAREETPFEIARSAAAEEKQRIGRSGAALVESGMSVLLDVGSTSEALAVALRDREDLDDVTVITNGLSIALALEPAIPRFCVIVTGGTLRPLQHSLVAPFASVLLSQLRADVAFIGCTGVSAAAGVTNVNLPETEVKRAILSAADRAVVVADSSKIGRTSLGVIAALADFETLITSAPTRENPGLRAELELIAAGGPTCIVAPSLG